MESTSPDPEPENYESWKERMKRELPPLPDDVDLEVYAREQGALPLEAFIDELERVAE